MPHILSIDESDIVNDVIARWPETVGVFNYFGIDACCGGASTIKEAAENEFVEVDSLIDALRNALRHGSYAVSSR